MGIDVDKQMILSKDYVNKSDIKMMVLWMREDCFALSALVH